MVPAAPSTLSTHAPYTHVSQQAILNMAQRDRISGQAFLDMVERYGNVTLTPSNSNQY